MNVRDFILNSNKLEDCTLALRYILLENYFELPCRLFSSFRFSVHQVWVCDDGDPRVLRPLEPPELRPDGLNQRSCGVGRGASCCCWWRRPKNVTSERAEREEDQLTCPDWLPPTSRSWSCPAPPGPRQWTRCCPEGAGRGGDVSCLPPDPPSSAACWRTSAPCSSAAPWRTRAVLELLCQPRPSPAPACTQSGREAAPTTQHSYSADTLSRLKM